jgi:hypothetical protein
LPNLAAISVSDAFENKTCRRIYSINKTFSQLLHLLYHKKKTMEVTFKINGKANHSKRPSALVVPSSLVLDAQQRAETQELINQKAPGIIEMLELRNDSDQSAFLHDHGLDLPQSDPLCKWAT